MLYIWVYTCNRFVLVFVPSSWHYFSFVYSSDSCAVCLWLCLWREIPVVGGLFLWGLCQQAAILWERAVFKSHRTVCLLIINTQMTSDTLRQKRGTYWFTPWSCVCFFYFNVNSVHWQFYIYIYIYIHIYTHTHTHVLVLLFLCWPELLELTTTILERFNNKIILI